MDPCILLTRYPQITAKGAAILLGCTPRTAARALDCARAWMSKSTSERLKAGHGLLKAAAEAGGGKLNTVHVDGGVLTCGHEYIARMTPAEKDLYMPSFTYVVEFGEPLASHDDDKRVRA